MGKVSIMQLCLIGWANCGECGARMDAGALAIEVRVGVRTSHYHLDCADRGIEIKAAAPPDLLAWLQAFVATLEHHDAEVKLSFTDSALNADILAALAAARAAIAKAKPA